MTNKQRKDLENQERLLLKNSDLMIKGYELNILYAENYIENLKQQIEVTKQLKKGCEERRDLYIKRL